LEKRGTKEEVLAAIDPILKEMVETAEQVIEGFKRYQCGNISEGDFISEIQKTEPRIAELYRQSGNIPKPPKECEDYDQACQNIFATIHDMFLYYTRNGLKTWDKKNRDLLMQKAIERFYENLKRIEIEKNKIK